MESISISEALRKLGLVDKGGNYYSFKKYVNLYNIDTKHFLGQKHLIGKKRKIKNTLLCEMLTENSYYDRGYIKERLLRDGILKNECSICGQKEEWNGKKLVMILDHINGTNNDNRIENLRMVCPNCNSQLDTHCGRKNKIEDKKSVCLLCGEKVYKGSIRCVKCWSKSERKIKERPSYEKLLEDVKKINYCGAGKKYGVSNTTIKKWLKRYEIEDLAKVI